MIMEALLFFAFIAFIIWISMKNKTGGAGSSSSDTYCRQYTDASKKRCMEQNIRQNKKDQRKDSCSINISNNLASTSSGHSYGNAALNRRKPASAAAASGSTNSRHSQNNSHGNKSTDLPSLDMARGESQGVPQCKFLLSARQHLQRDYVLIIDRSGSMSMGGRWKQAEEAVTQLAPYICNFDPDGVDVFLFDHECVKMENVKSDVEVEGIFSSTQPRGSTDLAKVLNAAFEDHFAGERGATTVLVVTDGCPNSKKNVSNVIIKAANSLSADEELSISFLQIGDDREAAKFLEELDDDLEDKGAKYDIVDTIPCTAMRTLSFNEIIANSIYD